MTRNKKSAPAQELPDLRMTGTEVQICALARFKPNGWNPNVMTAHERASTRHGLLTEGWIRAFPLLVWGIDDKGERRDVIIDGEHRLEEATDLGFKEGPVVFLDGITEAQAQAFTVALTMRRGRAAEEPLKEVLRRIAASGEKIGALSLGLKEKDLARLIRSGDNAARALAAANAPADEGGDEDEEDIEPPKNPVTKLGDKWILGDHVLHCANCFKLEGLPKKIRAVVTDPPFAIYGSSTGIGADIADDKMVRPFFEQIFRVVNAHLVKFGAAYVFCDWRSWACVWDGCVSARGANKGGCNPKNLLVWDKGGGGLGSNYFNVHELVGYFINVPPVTAMKGTSERGIRSINRMNILRFPRVTGVDRVHNASKPPAMVAQFIEDATDKGDLVADFFVGGGTIFKAAEMTERRAVGVEDGRGWCDVAIQRWEEYTGGKAKRAA